MRLQIRFQNKTATFVCNSVAFIVEVLFGGCFCVFLGDLTHLHLHPLEETQQHQQRHRTEEAAHRDTPHSGWRRLFHPGRGSEREVLEML